MNLLNNVFPFSASGYQENVVYDNAPDTFPNISHVDYISDYDKYNGLLREVQIPLYPGNEHTVLGTVMEQMKIKNKHGKSNVCFDDDITLMKKVIPKGNSCPENFDHVVPNTEDIRVNNQHVLAIICYIPVTPFKLNSLQRNPNHDDDGFIDDEYIVNDEFSDQTEEDDDSDDSDYHEYD
ncbi:hypothetical protein ACLB2K_042005 [Fragaria x ananassa]